MANLPYVTVVGTLESMLEKIKTASEPDKFSQDFVANKLTMKGGSARAVIPFIKKMGLVSTDGTPTSRYREFRNPEKSGYAIAKALRELYSTLFEMNENAHELSNSKLKGLIVEATGAEVESSAVQKTLSTFNLLKGLAKFDASPKIDTPDDELDTNFNNGPLTKIHASETQHQASGGEGINLSYTINLNLPPTTDIEVFNAIFKSLKQHLLQE